MRSTAKNNEVNLTFKNARKADHFLQWLYSEGGDQFQAWLKKHHINYSNDENAESNNSASV